MGYNLITYSIPSTTQVYKLTLLIEFPKNSRYNLGSSDQTDFVH